MRVPRAVLVAVLVVVGAGCGGGERSSTRFPEGTPVVLISVDTLRSDRLPAYGYDGVDTPAVDALRADGVLFDRAYTPVPLTLPAHTSLLSGLLPPAHGVRDNVGYAVDPLRAPMLQSVLSEAGYATGAAVSAWVLRSSTGISEGFDTYDDRIAYVGGQGLQAVQRSGQETLQAITPWLGDVADQPFFLLLHLFEPHTPYAPPEPYASRYESAYDGEIAAADAVVGELVATLRRLEVYDRALIVFLSDHGEGLGEHGEAEHGLFLYRTTLQVPLILKLPGSEHAGETVAAPVSLVDVAPTVLDGLGLAGMETVPGRSLLEPLRGNEGARRPLLAETVYPRLHYGWSDLASVIEGPHQYIQAPSPELYNLVQDPQQLDELSRDEAEMAAELATTLSRWDRALEGPAAVGAEEQRRLQALGYVASGAATTEGPLPDPKERVGVLEELREAQAQLVAGELDRAAGALARVVEKEPRLEDAWSLLITAQERGGHGAAAAASVARALEACPGSAMLGLQGAGVLLGQDELDRAWELAGRAVEYDPATAHTLLAQIATRLGQLVEAERQAREAVAADSRRSGPWLVLARSLRAAGRSDEAVEELVSAGQTAVTAPADRARLARELLRLGAGKRAVALVSDAPSSADPEVLSAAAMVRAANGEVDEAVSLLERTLELKPGFGRARVELGLLTLARGDAAAARGQLEQGLQDDPSVAEGWNALGAVRAESGDLDGAIVAWERALFLDSELLRVHYNIAVASARSGRFSAAVEHLEQFADGVEGPDRERALAMLEELRRRAASDG